MAKSITFSALDSAIGVVVVVAIVATVVVGVVVDAVGVVLNAAAQQRPEAAHWDGEKVALVELQKNSLGLQGHGRHGR